MPERKLIPVAPEDLNRTWTRVRPGLEELASYSDGWIPEDVYHCCKAGQATLFLGEDDGRDEGFLVLGLRPGFRGPEMLIWAIWSPNAGHQRDMWLDEIKEIAQRAQARRLVFHSPRRAWARVAIDLGFKEQQVTYIMEL